MTDLQYVGKDNAVPVDGLDKVLGKARYVGDIRLPGMLYAKVLRSPIPHGKITQLDTSPAMQVKGVHAIITSEDFEAHGLFGWPVADAYILAYQKVRYVGDAVAVVAAESERAAEEGVKAIRMTLEPLPVVSTMDIALQKDSPQVPLDPPMDEHNLAAKHVVRNGDPKKYFDQDAKIIHRSYYFAHQEHAYLETEGVVAIPEPDGSVTIFANNQSPHINRDNAAVVLGMDSEKVRIIQPPVGGSFGGKDDVTYQATAQAAKLALLSGRPVRLVHSREESMAASYKREAMQIDLNIATDKTGKFKAARAYILADSGAYASMTPLSAWRATMHAAGAYRYDAATVDTQVIYTNNGYSGAFRGFGNTQAAAASEIMVDEIAEIFGQDPIDFRLKNCLKNGDHAFTGNALGEGVNIDRCLEWVRKASDWDTKRSTFNDKSSEGFVRRGIGVAGYFHGSGLGGEGVDYA
jgi:CO/xanthine dehydrogenase Mo-binding subunit